MKNIIFLKSLVLGLIILGAGASIIPNVLSKQSEKLGSEKSLIATWIVDDEGDGDFTSIQAAINNAQSGDIIDVYSGTYYENLLINKSIDLEGKATEYLSGTDSGKPIISGVSLNNVISIQTNNQDVPVKVSGFTVQNSGINHAGIYIQYSKSVTVSYNDVTQNHHGIQLYYCQNDNIQENFVAFNDWGIFSEFSDHCIITLNHIENNTNGIQMSVSNLMTITQNEIKNSQNGYGLILVQSSGNQVFFNNFINNDKQVWFKNCLNSWHDNYWSNLPNIIPIKMIIGTMQSTIIPVLKVPIIQFDLRPAATPNSI